MNEAILRHAVLGTKTMQVGRHAGEYIRDEKGREGGVHQHSLIRFGTFDCQQDVVIPNEIICRVLSLLGTQFCLLIQVRILGCT